MPAREIGSHFPSCEHLSPHPTPSASHDTNIPSDFMAFVNIQKYFVLKGHPLMVMKIVFLNSLPLYFRSVDIQNAAQYPFVEGGLRCYSNLIPTDESWSGRWLCKSDFRVSFVLCNATHNDQVKSNVMNIHQSS